MEVTVTNPFPLMSLSHVSISTDSWSGQIKVQEAHASHVCELTNSTDQGINSLSSSSSCDLYKLLPAPTPCWGRLISRRIMLFKCLFLQWQKKKQHMVVVSDTFYSWKLNFAVPSEGCDCCSRSTSARVSVFAAARAPEMEDLWKDEPTGNQFHGFTSH